MPKTSKTGQTAYAEISVWYDEASGEIHLAIPKTSWFVTTVNDREGSKRCHPNLFKKLARYLKEQGAFGPLSGTDG